MPNPRKTKRKLRKRDVERLENTSAVAGSFGPSDQCTCADLSCELVSGCAASCTVQSDVCDLGSQAAN